VKNCIRHNYNFLFANCDDVYKRESKPQANSTENNEQNEDGIPGSIITTTATTNVVGPSLKSLQFWHHFMYLLTRIISEDRERYSLVLNQ
jgi:hypothetical protein